MSLLLENKEGRDFFIIWLLFSILLSTFFLFLNPCPVSITSLTLMTTGVSIAPALTNAHSPHSLDIALQHTYCIATSFLLYLDGQMLSSLVKRKQMFNIIFFRRELKPWRFIKSINGIPRDTFASPLSSFSADLFFFFFLCDMICPSFLAFDFIFLLFINKPGFNTAHSSLLLSLPLITTVPR